MKLNLAKIDLALARSKRAKGVVAERMGISATRFSRLLQQIRNDEEVSPKNAGKLAEALEVDVSELI